MNVLSLFDGISCCRIALERAGIKVDSYYSSEIKNHAIKVSAHNWPEIIQLGDIRAWREWDIDWSSIDLVTGGFPCQTWSVAGKQEGDKDERGMMFWVMLDIMKHVKNNNKSAMFLIENVKMKREFEEYITHHTEIALGNVQKILINSALVSAQNRKRYYWTNFKCDQPDDKGVFINEIIGVSDLCSENKEVIDSEYFKKESESWYFERHRLKLMSIQPCRVSERGRRLAECGRKRDDANGVVVRGYEGADDGKTSCLTTVQKDNYILDRGVIRKLTPEECEQLQTVPVGYTSQVSKVQRIKLLGNAWTVDVISHLFKSMVRV